MTVMAAVALGGLFAGCSKDADLSGGQNSAEFNIVQNYENAFITRFGQPHANQTWGFGESVVGTRSGNTSGDYVEYPSTHQYYDANGKLIASANMNHNQWGATDLQSMPYGGWIVPDPLTEGQKLRVQKYFQANPNLNYEDPHYANFYIQQVYTGGTSAPTTGNNESTVSADGQGHKGMTLNQLTVGQAASHINDFNAGTCSPSDVLNHEGKTQTDQITLMLNVDDTSCFGFHETSGSNVNSNEDSNVYNHNDKMALVSAAVIDAWAAQNDNPGEAVVDKWNRSFMGFDYELLPESDIVTDSYALLSQVPNLNNIHYAWDGTNVMKIGQGPTGSVKADLNITAELANASKQNGTPLGADEQGVWTWDGQNFDVLLDIDATGYTKLVIEYAVPTPNNYNFSIEVEGSASYDQNRKSGETKVEYELNATKLKALHFMNGNGTFKIKSIYLSSGSSDIYYNPTYLLGDTDTDKIAFYSTNTNMYGGTIINLTENEMKTTQDGKTCLNLVKFQQLKNDGYHPITTDLKKWVKWQAACDGYYSDWIVTLTEAKRIDDGDDDDDDDEVPEGFVCRIIAEDLTVGENSDFDFNDVVFDVYSDGKLLVRACGGTLPLTVAGQEVHALFGESSGTMINTGWDGGTIDYVNTYRVINYGSAISSLEAANNIPVVVTKNGQPITLTAKKAKVASKVAVGSDYEWCAEREDIDKKFRRKNGTKLFREYVIGHLNDDWYQYRGK